MRHFRITIFALGIGILFAAGITFAAWQGTTWITNGSVIDAAKIKDNFEFLHDVFAPAYKAWNSLGTGGGGAAIYNDNGTFKKLMLVGNTSAGGAREVGIWDNLTVNGNITATGQIQGAASGIRFADGTTQTTAAGGGATYQTFSSSGTWTKPTTGTVAFVECWGGGGGASVYSGGGGGGYSSRTVALAALSSSVAVTIGSGGAYGYTTASNGGTSSFGQYLRAYGGGGGVHATGGGGGGPLSFGGADPGDWRGYANAPGRPIISSGAYSVPYSDGYSSGYTADSCSMGQGDTTYNSSTGCTAQDGYVHGGGGGTVGNGAASVYGGGGGGGNIYGAYAGGSSEFGGRGGNQGQSGVQPGGGGGAAGGSGAAGRCNVVVW